MSAAPYQPVFELTRGETVESVHMGAIAVVDAHNRLLAFYGDPQAVTFLRSTAKPFQALPLIERRGAEALHLSAQEVALTCASHSGTDEHLAVLTTMQAKSGVTEAELLCGTHFPFHEPTAEALRERKEKPTPNRHNCSGKHTGMLALAHLLDKTENTYADSLDYIEPAHPVQRLILETFADMCALPPSQVATGIDGCSAPNFAVPLYNAALAYARLADPEAGGVQPPERADACRQVTAAMMTHPAMVAGPDRFDTQLMELAQGSIVAKGGAEGYQGLALMPGVLAPGAPAVGIALKISDGDQRSSVTAAVALETLRQLSVLSADEIQRLSQFGPVLPVRNWRKIVVGEGRPNFRLKRA
ncbi:MAG TPA: asparaginase [Anaerolineales bacterium]|nr:asparaginase [Anaerolineales bacterium]